MRPLFIILGGVILAQKCKLLSLDTSSSKTGWAYFEDAKYKKSAKTSPKKADKKCDIMDV